MKPDIDREIRMIPIDRIDVLNTRDRNARAFEMITGNIQAIGLKKPITVAVRPGSDGAERYVVVCGEGRLKAYRNLGESRIPAQIISVSDEDAFIMSLAENIARRRVRPLELLAGISSLQDRGYSTKAIAEKTGLTTTYVHGILTLINQGEDRLLVAVQKGLVPLTVALTILAAGDNDKTIQLAMQEAYELGHLRGKDLVETRRIVERRRIAGPSVSRAGTKRVPDVTSHSLVRAYRKEVERKKLFARKAMLTEKRLVFIAGALRGLFADENFLNLLRAEGLDTLPRYLADRVASFEGGV
jgi:ParB family transcriptional regulator, chromosome partitioning protein